MRHFQDTKTAADLRLQLDLRYFAVQRRQYLEQKKLYIFFSLSLIMTCGFFVWSTFQMFHQQSVKRHLMALFHSVVVTYIYENINKRQ